MMYHNLVRLPVAVGLVALCGVIAGSPASADLLIDPIRIGHPNNPPHPQFGRGAVAYEYDMAKYPVTAGEYVEFLNTVDPTGANNLELYHPDMAEHKTGAHGCMITWNGQEYDFSARPGGTDVSDWENRPVNFVSWFSAARYANWLTSGDTESGAYQFDGLTTLVGINREQAVGQYGLAYVLPTTSEWYKAAYYDHDIGGYWNYPTHSDDITVDMANYFDMGGVGTTTDVNKYEEFASWYGTVDQGGNVYEWTESASGTNRYRLGGHFGSGKGLLHAEHSNHIAPTGMNDHTGFRLGVYYIPEPGTATMLLFGAIAGLLWRRRR